MPDLTLLVLAAGIGKRYRGLKQVESVGPSGEILLDYAVYDALRAGFTRLVFVIRRDFERLFRRMTGRYWEQSLPVSYVHQELDGNLPGGFQVPADRRKPWGTAQAVLLCREAIRTPFAVINADDFYGPGAFRALADWLRSRPESRGTGIDEFGFVGYPLKKTLSEYGYVSRGICALDRDGYLTGIIERLRIEKSGEGARAEDGPGRWLHLTGDEIASMNFWGFTPEVFRHLETGFADFLKRCAREPDAEFYLPSAINDMIASGKARVKHLPAAETWFGITYPGDLARARLRIRELVDRRVYPENLKVQGGPRHA